MKKIFFLSCISGFVALSSFAQNVWTGSSISTITSGKVGIGTGNPGSMLDISTNNTISPHTQSLYIANWSRFLTSRPIMSIYNMSNAFPTPPPALLFSVDGIQTTIPTKLQIGGMVATGAYANYKLSVDGDIIARRCVIQVTNWADYVFAPDYALPSLNDVEVFIKQNKHLPGVPSEAEVKEKGIEVGDMNKVLLQKVEELTLYMIDLQKENVKLKEKVAHLESVIPH